MIRDLGVTLAMRPEPDDRPHGAERADGQGRAADSTARTSAHRRLRLGHPAAGGAADDRDADARRHGDGVLARGLAARRRLVHRRRRIVARRVARGDQPVRRAAAAGDLLRPEQPDGAVDAGRGSVGRARVRRQGRRLRHARHHDRRHRSRRDRRRVRAGRPSARAPGSGRRSSSSSRCACAATRITTTCCISAAIRSRRGTYPPLAEQGYANRELYEYWAARDPIALYAARLEAEGIIAAGRSRSLQARGRGARRSARRGRSSTRRGRSRRRPASACSRTRRRASTSRCSIPTVRLSRDARRCGPRRSRPRRAERAAVRPEGPHVPRRRDARRRRRAARRSARVRLRRGRRRRVRQRVPAAAAAAEGVRRPHHQLAARRGRRARRLRRRGARRPAADRRDAVQRLRRDRLQSARQQRGEDPLPLGRRRADGGAHAVGRAAPRRPVSLAEHRGVVLPHARPEDRRARRRRTTRAR